MAPKIRYNQEEEILSIRFKKSKSVDSDIQGNVVIDFGKNGEVINIDIMKINLNNFVSVAGIKKSPSGLKFQRALRKEWL